ncbi:MAG: universal stress protein [Ilumatobacter sp.]|jgi:nucleotide-binding universal stress UspA family protein|uniref:universal stress protein n=1 Tax=Ilumatobacter sp. TaxID=1967498 RepID=UPI003918B848
MNADAARDQSSIDGASLSNPVVVGVDGSAEARRGMLFAADLSTRLDVELVAVHARGLLERIASGAGSGRSEAVEALETNCLAVLSEIDGLRWSWKVEDGAPIDVLLRVADEVDAGFVVVGSHGAGHSDEPLLGSTSHWVVRNSHRPVIVVPPGDNHPHHRRPFGAGGSLMGGGVADH